MAVPLRPQYFLSREDGTLTALVAIDELPSFISIRGVPRTLSHNDTQGMTSLGTVNSRGQHYLLDNQLQAVTRPSNGNIVSDGINNGESSSSGARRANDDGLHAGHGVPPGWNPETQPWKSTGYNGREVVKYVSCCSSHKCSV